MMGDPIHSGARFDIGAARDGVSGRRARREMAKTSDYLALDLGAESGRGKSQ
jgi:hypothetical protein